ncbi:MAG TPA: methyltransferase domain-containing protein [Polyangiales bacterium]|nr:methyltransferase domain-containing protein [Polyangiales bacterium]
MAFYDVFANFYDASLERAYAPQRALAAEALRLEPAAVVLDVPCGTGQSFDVIGSQLGPSGLLLAADASSGMLKRATARAAGRNIRCFHADASTLTAQQLADVAGRTVLPTRLHVFLGMSVFTDMRATFDNLWKLLAPGGVCVLVDVHSERLSMQGWLVNQIARAEIRRRFWEPLERVAENFERHDLPYNKQHGGQIMLASGRKA